MGLGIVTTAAAPAHAMDELDKLARLVLTTASIAAAGDITFATYAIVVAGKGELPSRGWAIAEMVFTIPQTILGHIVYGSTEAKGNAGTALEVLFLIPAINASMLSTHGTWATASG